PLAHLGLHRGELLARGLEVLLLAVVDHGHLAARHVEDDVVLAVCAAETCIAQVRGRGLGLALRRRDLGDDREVFGCRGQRQHARGENGGKDTHGSTIPPYCGTMDDTSSRPLLGARTSEDSMGPPPRRIPCPSPFATFSSASTRGRPGTRRARAARRA